MMSSSVRILETQVKFFECLHIATLFVRMAVVVCNLNLVANWVCNQLVK